MEGSKFLISKVLPDNVNLRKQIRFNFCSKTFPSPCPSPCPSASPSPPWIIKTVVWNYLSCGSTPHTSFNSLKVIITPKKRVEFITTISNFSCKSISTPGRGTGTKRKASWLLQIWFFCLEIILLFLLGHFGNFTAGSPEHFPAL